MSLNIFAAIRQKNKSRFVVEEPDTENLLDNLVSKLPPQDTWDAEYFLGILVLGYVDLPHTVPYVRYKYMEGSTIGKKPN